MFCVNILLRLCIGQTNIRNAGEDPSGILDFLVDPLLCRAAFTRLFDFKWEEKKKKKEEEKKTNSYISPKSIKLLASSMEEMLSSA